MLEVRDLSVRYGRVRALDGVSLDLAPGAALCVAGLNGAGKSSLARALAGLVAPSGGEVRIGGAEMGARPPHLRPGVALVPEGRVLAPTLTVEETLRLGARGAPARAMRARRAELLDRFPELAARLRHPAGTLSGGEATLLSLARALMAAPRLLLLDEPMLGLSPAACDRVAGTIRALRGGPAILLIEQTLAPALALCDRVLVLRAGRAVHAGPAGDPRVIEDLLISDKENPPC